MILATLFRDRKVDVPCSPCLGGRGSMIHVTCFLVLVGLMILVTVFLVAMILMILAILVW